MAVEYTRNVLCDICMREEQRRTQAPYSFTASIGQTGGDEDEGFGNSIADCVIDLCEEHRKPLTDVIELLLSYGRKETERREEDRPRSKVTREALVGEEIVCPLCGHVASKRDTMRQHIDRVHHGRSISELIPRDNKIPEQLECPYCGRSLFGRTGLGVHKATKHRVEWLAEKEQEAMRS